MALAAYLKNVKRDLASIIHSQTDTPTPIHVVIGNESCDLDSVVCALVYSFFLQSTSKGPSSPSVFPVLNLPRHLYHLRLEVNAHLSTLGIAPQDHLIFIDDPDLDLTALTSRSEEDFEVTLVDHHQMSSREECFRPFVRDVLDHRPLAEILPDSWNTEIEGVGSCASLVTHRIMDHGSFTVDPVSAQLLLGAVLSDTVNLSEKDAIANDKDRSAVSRLERSLPAKVTCQGIYDLIKEAKFDLSVLTVGEMLVKDLKVVKGNHITVASSSITMDLEDVLSRVEFSQHACSFCRDLPADVLVILTISMGSVSISRRCVAVYSENRVYREQITDVLLRASSPNLVLRPLNIPSDLEHVTAFNQSNLRTSRKGILPLISEFLSGEANTPENEHSGADDGSDDRGVASSRGHEDNNENAEFSIRAGRDSIMDEGDGGGGSRVSRDDNRTEEEDVFCEMQMRRHINMAKIAQSDHFRTSQDVFDLAAVGTQSLISPSLSSDSACDFESLDGGVGGSEGLRKCSRNSSVDGGGEGVGGVRKTSNSSVLSSQMAEVERREVAGGEAVSSSSLPAGIDLSTTRATDDRNVSVPENSVSNGGGDDASKGSFDKDNVDNITNNNVATAAAVVPIEGETDSSSSSCHTVDTSNNSNNTTVNSSATNVHQQSDLLPSGSGTAGSGPATEEVPSYPETPPNSYCMSPVVGQETVRQTHLPSFNSKEMVERIQEKKKAMAMRNSSAAVPCRLGLESGGGGDASTMMTSSASGSEFGPSLTVLLASSGGIASSGGAGSSLMSPVVPQNSYMSCTDIAGTYGQLDSPTSMLGLNSAGKGGAGAGSGSAGGGVDIPRLARAGIEEKVNEKRSHFDAWTSSSSPGAGDLSGGPYTPQNSYANSGQGSMMNLAENLTSLNSAEVVAKIRAKQAAMFGNCSSRASASSEDSIGGCRSPGGPAGGGGGGGRSRGISMESPVHAFTPQNSYKDGLGVLEARGRLTDLNEVVERLNTTGEERSVGGGGGKTSGSSNSGGDSRDEDVGGGGGGGGGGGCGGGGGVGGGEGCGGGGDVLSVVGVGAAGKSGVGSARHSSSQSDSQNTMSDVESLLSMSLDCLGTPASDTGSGSVGGVHCNIVASGLAGAMRSDFASASASATPKDDVFTPGGQGQDHKSRVVFGFNHVDGGGAVNGMDKSFGSSGGSGVVAPPNSIGDNGVMFNLVSDDGIVVGCSRSNSDLFSPLNESAMMEGEIEMFQAAENIVSQSIAAAALKMGDGVGGAGSEIWKLVNGEVGDGSVGSRSDAGCSKTVGGGGVSFAPPTMSDKDAGVCDNDSGEDDCSSSVSDLTSECVSSVAKRDGGSVSFVKRGDEQISINNNTGVGGSIERSSPAGSKRQSVGFHMGGVGSESGSGSRATKKRVGLSEPGNDSCCEVSVENGLDDAEDDGDDSGCGTSEKNCVVGEEEEGLTDAALSELAYEWARDLIQGVLDNFPHETSSPVSPSSRDGVVDGGGSNGPLENGEGEDGDDISDGGVVGSGVPGKGYSAVPRLSIVITDNQGVNVDGLAELAKIARGGRGGKDGDEEEGDDEEDVDGFSVEALDGSVGDIYREDTVDLEEDEEDAGKNENFDDDDNCDDEVENEDDDANNDVGDEKVKDCVEEDFCVDRIEEDVGSGKGVGGGGGSNPMPNVSSGSRKSSKSSSSSFDSSSAGVCGERKWSREMDVSATTIKEHEVVTSFPERRCSSEVRFHDILEDYDDSPITSFPGRKISISEDYPRRFSREDSTRRQSNLTTDTADFVDGNRENDSGNDNDEIVKSDLETEYLPNMDPLHGNLDIVTSNEASFSTMTDSGREVVEGESFRRVSGHELPANDLNLEQSTTPSPSASALELGGIGKEKTTEEEEGSRVKVGDGVGSGILMKKSNDAAGSASIDGNDLAMNSEGRSGDTSVKVSGKGDNAEASAFSIGTGDSQDDDDAFCEGGGGDGAVVPITPPAVSEIKKAKKRIRVSFSHDIEDEDLEYLAQVSSPRTLRSPPPPVSPSAEELAREKALDYPDDGSRKGSADDLERDGACVVVGVDDDGKKEEDDSDDDDDFELDPSVMRGAREIYLTSAGRISIAGEEEEAKKGGGIGGRVDRKGKDGRISDLDLGDDPLTDYSRQQGAVYRDEWQDDDIQDMAGIGQSHSHDIDQTRKKIVPDTNLRVHIDDDDEEEEEDDDVIDENTENDLEWENDTPITQSTLEEIEANTDLPRYRTVQASGSLFEMDMELVSPYKAVLSHGGYYDEGLTAIIVFYGYQLPHRRHSDYRTVMNHLFHHVINILDELVADDYVIVYFHGSTPKQQMPGFQWLRRCYRCIDRRLKKNLKGLFLVHPTLWLRTVVAMTRPFISSKFSSKLKFVRDLQELKSLVPLENVTIPPVVLHYDRYKQHLPTSSSSPMPSSSSSPSHEPLPSTSVVPHPHPSSSSSPSSSPQPHQPTSSLLLHSSTSSSPHT